MTCLQKKIALNYFVTRANIHWKNFFSKLVSHGTKAIMLTATTTVMAIDEYFPISSITINNSSALPYSFLIMLYNGV